MSTKRRPRGYLKEYVIPSVMDFNEKLENKQIGEFISSRYAKKIIYEILYCYEEKGLPKYIYDELAKTRMALLREHLNKAMDAAFGKYKE